MSTITQERPQLRARRPLRQTLVAAAGVAYAVCWIIGLSVASVSTTVRSSDADVVRNYSQHIGLLTLQFLFTEAGAGTCLALFALLLGRTRVVATTGVAAGVISVAQSVVGITLVRHAAAGGDHPLAGTLFEVMNRTDGAKMLILAGLTFAGSRLVGLPRWLRVVGLAATVALVGSAIGYLLLNTTLAYAAWASLPLLVVWVTGAAVTLSRRTTAGAR